MKIRTDFVTNSSSYSSAEIVIDNPVLLEILQKYKDKGTFDPGDSDYSIGEYVSYEEYPPTLPNYRQISNTPALYVGLAEGSNSWGNIPSKLNEVIRLILYCLEDGDSIVDKVLFEQMKAEVDRKRKEILASYMYVSWKIKDSSNEGNEEPYNGDITESELFTFDPVRGEEYLLLRKAGHGSDEKIRPGFIFAEKHVVNEEIIVDFKFEPGEGSEELEEEDEEDE